VSLHQLIELRDRVLNVSRCLVEKHLWLVFHAPNCHVAGKTMPRACMSVPEIQLRIEP
jgi:hypothetical protein